MKLDTPKNVESNLNSLGFETENFTISNNGKMFRILADQLYSNKIAAPIRELGSNAYDAHVEAGIPERPFEVSLPTQLSPYFSIRDFGPSMPHDRIMRHYVNMGGSDKHDKVDQVGAFGLGSKSPFAYTDSFQIQSFRDGQESYYVVAYNTDNIPTITHLGTKPSTEESGLKIILPVRREDFYSFEREAKSIFQWFRTPPLGVEISPQQAVFERGAWKVYRGHSASCYVRQGCVVYPVNQGLLNLHIPLHYGFHVVLDVPLGFVEVTPSRESLSMSPKTKAFLNEAFNAVRKDMESYCQEQVNEAKTRLQAYRKSQNLTKCINYAPTQWTDPEGVVHDIRYFEVKVGPDFYQLRTGVGRKKVSDPPTTERFDHAQGLLGNEPIMVLIDEGQKMVRRKVRLQEYAYDYNVWVLKDRSRIPEIKALLEINDDNFLNIDEIPDVEVVRAPRTGAAAESLRSGIYTWHGFKLEIADEELADKYLWVPINANLTIDADVLPFNGKRLSTAYYGFNPDTAISQFDEDLTPPNAPILIYGFKPQAQKRLNPPIEMRLDNWLTTEYTKHLDLVKEALEFEMKMNYIHDYMLRRIVVEDFAPKWNKSDLDRMFIKKIDPSYFSTIDEPLLEAEATKLKQEIETKYPLIRNFGYSEPRQEYIALVEKCNELETKLKELTNP